MARDYSPREKKQTRRFLEEHTSGRPKSTRGEDILRGSTVHGGPRKEPRDEDADRITSAD